MCQRIPTISFPDQSLHSYVPPIKPKVFFILFYRPSASCKFPSNGRPEGAKRLIPIKVGGKSIGFYGIFTPLIKMSIVSFIPYMVNVSEECDKCRANPARLTHKRFCRRDYG
jgi:hypothetical protein